MRTAMKKMIFFAGIATVALLASCTKEIAPVEEFEGSSAISAITLNLKVSGLNDETKALKTGWAAGDVIDIWFDSNSQKLPDLVAKYDGSAWAADGTATVSGNVPAGSGTVTAIYFAAANQNEYGWDSADITAPASGGKVVSDLVAYSQKMAYTYSESTLTANLSSWKYLANTQIVLAGSALDEGSWAMKCDKLKAATGFNLSDGEITAAYSDAGTFVLGQPNADGLAFYFLAESDASQDYEIAIYDLTGDQKYYYTATGKTLTSSVTARKAVKIAQSKFGRDYYYDFLDGKDIVVGNKTFNNTNTSTLVQSNINHTEFASRCNSSKVVFLDENVVVSYGATSFITYEVAIIGRRENGKQPEIAVSNNTYIGNRKDLALKNICLTYSNSLFAPLRSTGATSSFTLTVEDCTIKSAAFGILDYNNNCDIANLYFNNNIVSYSSKSTTHFMADYTGKTPEKVNYIDYTITNNVFYYNNVATDDAGNKTPPIFNLANSTSYPRENLVITFSNNTIYNDCSQAVIAVGSCKQVNFDKNVWETSIGMGNLFYNPVPFSLKMKSPEITPTSSTSTCHDNWLYSSNYDGSSYTHYFVLSSTYLNFSGNSNKKQGDIGAGSLLGEINANKLYFPVNPAKVGTAGASYDTKKWVLRDWTPAE